MGGRWGYEAWDGYSSGSHLTQHWGQGAELDLPCTAAAVLCHPGRKEGRLAFVPLIACLVDVESALCTC